METRNKTEYKIYVLCLANMHGGVDKSRPVAVFDDIEKLKTYYNSQLAPGPYIDTPSEDNYGNTHSWQGSALEWYNPLTSFDVQDWNNVAFGGVISDWVDNLSFNVPFNPTTITP